MKDIFAFWDWFSANEERFRDVHTSEKEFLLDEILEQLQNVSTGLWFEIGTADDGVHELIITAEGNPDYLSDVRKLVAAAPKITGWRFIPFKPPNGFEFTTEYEGIVFAPESTWFRPLFSPEYPSDIAIEIGYAHYSPLKNNEFLTGTYIMLECAIGELSVAEDIQYIRVAMLPDAPKDHQFRPIAELPEFLKARLAAPN